MIVWCAWRSRTGNLAADGSAECSRGMCCTAPLFTGQPHAAVHTLLEQLLCYQALVLASSRTAACVEKYYDVDDK
jgi:hypothetical protein